jgi:hypothetical protein
MQKLFNVDHQTAVIDPIESIAVQPGESYDFTDEQVAAGLAGSWSDEDPRAGLKAERAFKKRRDAKTSPSPDEQTPEETPEGESTDPAAPEKE